MYMDLALRVLLLYIIEVDLKSILLVDQLGLLQ